VEFGEGVDLTSTCRWPACVLALPDRRIRSASMRANLLDELRKPYVITREPRESPNGA